VPTPTPLPLAVTFYNCGAPYPCERIENLSDAPVVVTLRNSHREETVTIAPHDFIVVALDKTDND